MKIHCGTDLVFIPRFKKIVDKHGGLSLKNKFLLKLFSEAELQYILKRKNPVPTLAGRFAAKEATVKAFSKIIPLASYNKILILNDVPELCFENPLSVPPYKSVSVSITHDGAYAQAMVTLLM